MKTEGTIYTMKTEGTIYTMKTEGTEVLERQRD